MSTAALGVQSVPGEGLLAKVNGRWHRKALIVFGIIVLAHWVEHVVQAIQIWGFDMARPKAKGALGYLFPWLVESEALHYGYALVMLAGLALLLPGFTGRSKAVWGLALAIQVWHHFEHALLLYQAQANHNLFDKPMPTSLLQLMWQRAELHLFYNALVTVPMLVALWMHMWPNQRERASMRCSCGLARQRPVAIAAA